MKERQEPILSNYLQLEIGICEGLMKDPRQLHAYFQAAIEFFSQSPFIPLTSKQQTLYVVTVTNLRKAKDGSWHDKAVYFSKLAEQDFLMAYLHYAQNEQELATSNMQWAENRLLMAVRCDQMQEGGQHTRRLR